MLDPTRVPRGRMRSARLYVRVRDDRVVITSRRTATQWVAGTVAVALLVTLLLLWRAGVPRPDDLVRLAFLGALFGLPFLVLGGLWLRPRRRLVASAATGDIVLQTCSLLPLRTVRLEEASLHHVRAVATTDEELVATESGSLWGLATLATLGAPAVLGAGVGLADVLTHPRGAVRIPAFCLEIVLQDGRSAVPFVTREPGDVQRALAALLTQLPGLEVPALPDSVGEGLREGDRVRVSMYHDWARGVTGTVRQPPRAVAEYGPPWEGVLCRTGHGVEYWVTFDEPQPAPDSGHPWEGAQIPGLLLERR